MKFNNKLNLPEYIRLVDEIAEGYFNQETGEYTPHIGEIHTAYLYFKYCAVAEDCDEVTPENIDIDGDVDIEKLKTVLDDSEFITAFTDNVLVWDCEYLSFGNAYHNAMLIVDSKVENGGLLVQRVINGLQKIAETFTGTLTDENVEMFAHAVEDIKNGKLSAQSIVDAYANSDRFAQNTEDSKIIELPNQK